MKNPLFAVFGIALSIFGIYLGGSAALGSWAFVAAISYAMTGNIKTACFSSAVIAVVFALATGATLMLTQAWSAAALIGVGFYMALEYGESTAQS